MFARLRLVTVSAAGKSRQVTATPQMSKIRLGGFLAVFGAIAALAAANAPSASAHGVSHWGYLSCLSGEVRSRPPTTELQYFDHYNGAQHTLYRWTGSQWVEATEAWPRAKSEWLLKPDVSTTWHRQDGTPFEYTYWRVQPGYYYAVWNAAYDYGDGHWQGGWSQTYHPALAYCRA